MNYTNPDGHKVNSREAAAQIRKMIPKLRANGHESAAKYVKRGWQPIAARPSTWAELAELAS